MEKLFFYQLFITVMFSCVVCPVTTKPVFDILPPENEDFPERGILNFNHKALKKAKRRRGSRWADGTVPFEVDAELPHRLKKSIRRAVAAWNSDFSDCIAWVERERQQDFVLFRPGETCHSAVGRTGGKQTIVLSEKECGGQGFIHHEMNHAIGFSHEHNRPDRDNFVKVLFRNIPKKWHSQYMKESAQEAPGSYDYYSLMHYEVEVPKGGPLALKVLDTDVDVLRIGQREGLTDIDKNKIRAKYCRQP